MEPISSYLKNILKLGFEDEKIRNTFTEVIKEMFDFELKKEQISYKNGGIKIKVSGPLKTEINFKKEKILEILNQRLSSGSVECQKIVSIE